MTTNTLNSNGTYAKLTNCTPGQTCQFFFKAVVYVDFSFSRGEEPSMIAMEERKQKRFVGVKRSWSRATRAPMVVYLPGSVTRRWRKANQVVAAGPKIAVIVR